MSTADRLADVSYRRVYAMSSTAGSGGVASGIRAPTGGSPGMSPRIGLTGTWTQSFARGSPRPEHGGSPDSKDQLADSSTRPELFLTAPVDPVRLNLYLRIDQEEIDFDKLEVKDKVVMVPYAFKERIRDAELLPWATGLVIAKSEKAATVRWTIAEDSTLAGVDGLESEEPKEWVNGQYKPRKIPPKTKTGVLADLLVNPYRRDVYGLDLRGLHALCVRCMPRIRDKRTNMVLPHTYVKTKEIFAQIDLDGNNRVTTDEIVSYCNKHDEQVDAFSSLKPHTWRDWLWVFTATTGARDTYQMYHALLPEDKSMTPADKWSDCCGCRVSTRLVCWVLLLVKVISQIMIVISCLVVMIESLPEHQNPYVAFHYSSQGTDATFALDCVSNAWFTLELIGWTIAFPWSHKWRHYFLEQETWVNLLSVLPFYIMFMVPSREGAGRGEWTKIFPAIRMVRLIRLLRLYTGWRSLFQATDILRQTQNPKLITALRAAATPLVWLSLLVTTLCAIASTFYFYAELHQSHYDFSIDKWVRNNDSEYGDPGQPVPLQSVPECLWWAIVTLTTVGYGDFSPVTPPGKAVASVVMIVSMVLYALPITIIGSTFAEMYQADQEYNKIARNRRDFRLGLLELIDTLIVGATQDTCQKKLNAARMVTELREFLHTDGLILQHMEVARRESVLQDTAPPPLPSCEQVAALAADQVLTPQAANCPFGNTVSDGTQQCAGTTMPQLPQLLARDETVAGLRSSCGAEDAPQWAVQLAHSLSALSTKLDSRMHSLERRIDRIDLRLHHLQLQPTTMASHESIDE
eukprot:TRINITY_DN1761_c0_g1_i2.p1 TRINITY_DN1761_c0_g1~~TRINITY_DN1761_c0_g1_i2.p1  ORF type:complete len:832 (+),score=278.62 TRINITY_DN1761_c0_g1_i2:87-2498(+)